MSYDPKIVSAGGLICNFTTDRNTSIKSENPSAKHLNNMNECKKIKGFILKILQPMKKWFQ